MAVEIATIRLRVMAADARAGTVTGHPVGERWQGHRPDRMPLITISDLSIDAQELAARLAMGEDVQITTEPAHVVAFTRQGP